jgi:hypothetical protein
MAELVERLMGLNADGTPMETAEQLAKKIGAHYFFAAVGEVVHGRLTAASVKSLFDMSSAEQSELNALAALMPAAGNQVGRALFIESIHGVFMLAEGRFPGYSTPAEVRAKLGI